MARRQNLDDRRSFKKLLSESLTESNFETVDKDQSGGGDDGSYIALQKSQNNYGWREKNGGDQIRAKGSGMHQSDDGVVYSVNRINIIENIESQKAFDRLQKNNNLVIEYDEGPSKCHCLEKLHLKIESELDRLRGLFRQREQELFHPLSFRLQTIEERLYRLEQDGDIRYKE